MQDRAAALGGCRHFKISEELACIVHDKIHVHGNVNAMASMNIRPLSAVALEKALADKLRELLGGIPWLAGVQVERNPAEFQRAFDLLAWFQAPKGPKIELWVDCRAEPRPSQFPYVALEREFAEEATKQIRVRVFAAPHISARLAEICESHGWSWFDLAGNCWISVPGVLHLEHTGNEPVHVPPRPAANLGTREAGRVVRSLLTPFYAGHEWTQRSMQMNCQPEVSLGLVNKVVRHLRDESFIEPLPNGGFRLSDPLKLLFAWRDAYRFDQHERHGYFTLLQGRQLREALAALDGFTGGFAAYAAFSAAEIHAPHVRQPKTWLFVANRELDRFAEMVQAKPVDSGENVVVLAPSDDGVFFHADGGHGDEHRLRCTNPVQTYVDLWHCGGRGREAAEAVLEQQLKPAWRAIGRKA